MLACLESRLHCYQHSGSLKYGVKFVSRPPFCPYLSWMLCLSYLILPSGGHCLVLSSAEAVSVRSTAHPRCNRRLRSLLEVLANWKDLLILRWFYLKFYELSSKMELGHSVFQESDIGFLCSPRAGHSGSLWILMPVKCLLNAWSTITVVGQPISLGSVHC